MVRTLDVAGFEFTEEPGGCNTYVAEKLVPIPNDIKFIYRDLNDRLRCRYASEDIIIGDFFFRDIQKSPELHANRNFIIQLYHLREC